MDETARHFLGAGLHQRNVPRWCRWRSRMLLGVGLRLLFLPTLTASYDGVPFGKTDLASAWLKGPGASPRPSGLLIFEFFQSSTPLWQEIMVVVVRERVDSPGRATW